MITPNILGIGAAFPPYTESMGRLKVVTGKDIIDSSIAQILGTCLGERLMNPEFGSMLPRIVFEPNDQAMLTMINMYVREPLEKFEPRITVNGVSCKQYIDQNRIDIVISYTIISEQRSYNYVYPYYT